jgi:hypothetical protein
MPVLGMGGLFFRSKDPDALSAWYKEHLGIGAGCNSTGEGAPTNGAGGRSADRWSLRRSKRTRIISPLTRRS